jgi:hypothetical protein
MQRVGRQTPAIFATKSSPLVAPVPGGGYKAVGAITMLICGKSGIH